MPATAWEIYQNSNVKMGAPLSVCPIQIHWDSISMPNKKAEIWGGEFP